VTLISPKYYCCQLFLHLETTVQFQAHKDHIINTKDISVQAWASLYRVYATSPKRFKGQRRGGRVGLPQQKKLNK